ncbi:MAG TPA: hypothetical protein IAB06_00210 [Candidatus Avacidaminococcus intestinavium]|uniref:Uncharacterized protein n=1 Tax=Candidatus Avacidaminococcus intestinavium TaxID=2840684 RepID=A0A9D1MND1_9FIRM|nr:hypothetical protein [Candidatus Avacidaminococcus intestinavium]
MNDFWQYVGLILSIFFAYKVYMDAKERGNDAAIFWAASVFLAWIIVLPFYWFKNVKE